MKKLLLPLLLVFTTLVAANAEERSFTITFGAEAASTTSLTNDNFTTAVQSGQSYISEVTSTIAVFPEKDCIKLSSAKTSGGFNIHLTEEASIQAKRIEVVAARYDNTADADAGIYINSEPLDVPSTEQATYGVDMVAVPLPVLTNLIIKVDHRVYLYSITVYYDSESGTVPEEKDQVATPLFTPGSGNVSAGTQVEISCATEDATIRYTLDGTEPNGMSTEYTEPISIDATTTIKAVAFKDGMLCSEVATATYMIANENESSLVYVFDFANPTTLNPAIDTPAQKKDVLLDGRTFTNGDIAVSFQAGETGNTHVRLYGSYDAGCDLRMYDGDSMTVRTLNPSLLLDNIVYEISLSGTSDVDLDPSVGEYIWEDCTWTCS
jgi:hypothetical protein